MVVALIKHNPLLRAINVHFPCRQQSLQEVINAWGSNLRDLQLWHGIRPRYAKRLLERLPESIQKVAVYIHLANDEKDHDHSATFEQVRPHHSLESVHIVGSFNGYQEYVLLSFLTSCSESLKAFKCPETSCFRNKNICTALARLGLSFKTLHIGELPSGRGSTDADIAQVIFSNPQLASIDLGRCREAGLLTAAAIRNNVNSLNHLDVRSCTNLTSRLLQSILCKARNLKSIKFMDETFESIEGVVLQAIDLVKQKWACSDLEVFQGMIQVPRPMGDDDDWDEDVNLLEERRALQRGVFRQLGRQTKLRELRLGQRYEVWEDAEYLYLEISQFSCLEMTLENGLEELIGLKELRLLDVYSMEHGITETERDWMRTHWPKFEELREQGCYDDPPRNFDEEYSMEQDYKNLKDQKRVEEMESDAKGCEVEGNDEGSGPMNGVNSEYEGNFQEDNDGEEETHGDVRERAKKAVCYGGECFV